MRNGSETGPKTPTSRPRMTSSVSRELAISTVYVFPSGETGWTGRRYGTAPNWNVCVDRGSTRFELTPIALRAEVAFR